MSIKVRRLLKNDYDLWDVFVHKSSNGTIFNLRTFLSYHIDRTFNDHSLIFENNNNIIALLPAAIINKNKKIILFSHPGASYGGIIYNNLNFKQCNEIIDLLKNYCKKNNISSMVFIPPPHIYCNNCSDTLLYTLLWNGFKIQETYLSSIINLNKYKHTIDFLGSRKKRYVKKIQNDKNFKIEFSNDINNFYPILYKNKQKHNSLPTHSKKEMQKLMEILPNNFFLMMLYFKNVPIGGTFNFIANKNVGIIFYNMIDYNFIKYNPATYQVYKTLDWARTMKLKFLDFGVSQLPNSINPLAPHSSLIQFKEQFSSKGMIRIVLEKII